MWCWDHLSTAKNHRSSKECVWVRACTCTSSTRGMKIINSSWNGYICVLNISLVMFQWIIQMCWIKLWRSHQAHCSNTWTVALKCSSMKCSAQGLLINDWRNKKIQCRWGCHCDTNSTHSFLSFSLMGCLFWLFQLIPLLLLFLLFRHNNRLIRRWEMETGCFISGDLLWGCADI